MCVNFTDLNNVCFKNSYPLLSIDTLVDSISRCDLLGFMDVYFGYNQIWMHLRDDEETTFMVEKANYCFKVMSFGLKNAETTYQRLMDKILQPMIWRNVLAYVMLESSTNHKDDLEELFSTINKYQLKLNPKKCLFSVKARKFMGFLLIDCGIEANPDKCLAIMNTRSPTNAKEVKRDMWLLFPVFSRKQVINDSLIFSAFN